MGRDYGKEYRNYQGTPEQIANRSQRNKARRILTKQLGASRLEGKDVGHVRGIDQGGSNVRSNLRVEDVHRNRARKFPK